MKNLIKWTIINFLIIGSINSLVLFLADFSNEIVTQAPMWLGMSIAIAVSGGQFKKENPKLFGK